MTRRRFHHAPEGVRRQDLINATLDCIAEHGLRGATVRRIAQRADVTAGLIRYYFPGKNELIHAAYRETMSRMTEQARVALKDEDESDDTGGRARARLRRFIEASLSPPVVDSRTLTFWATFISYIHVDPGMAAIHRESYLDYRNEVEVLIGAVFAEEGRDSTPGERADTAIAINALIDGLWIEGCLAGEMFGQNRLVAIGASAVEAVLDRPLRPVAKRISNKETP